MYGVPELLMEVAIAMALGGLIGLEREHAEHKKYAGIRTLTLLTGIAPGIVALTEISGSTAFLPVYLFLAVAVSIGVVAVRVNLEGEKIGFTTSTAVFASSVIGLLIGFNMYSEGISIAILVALVLAEKEKLHSYVDKLSEEEITSAFQLGVLAFVLLPVLPSTAVDPFKAVVPQEVMLIAVFVLSIEFLSYISMRQLGPSSGIYLTGLLGGAASSFATTGVLSRIGKESPDMEDPAASAILLSTVSMMVRNIGVATVIFLPVISSGQLLKTLYLPVAGMVIPLLFIAYLDRGEKGEGFEMPIHSPFSLRSGIKFASIYIIVSIVSVTGAEMTGEAWVLIAAFAGGMASSAAVTTSAATSFMAGTLGAGTGSAMILLSIAGSLASKLGIIELVNPSLRVKVGGPLLMSAVVGLALFTVI